MAKVLSSVELSPVIHELFDAVDLGNGRFAIAGSDAAFSSTANAATWWFDATGDQYQQAAIIADATTWQEQPDIAAGPGDDVVAAHLVRGEWSVLTTPLTPGMSVESQTAFEPSVVSLTNAPEIESWGKGYALAQVRWASFSDHGINISRVSADGTAEPFAVVKTENRVFPAFGDNPVIDVHLTETKGSGLAIVAKQGTTQSSGAIWLWLIGKSGAEKASLRIDTPGSALNNAGADGPALATLSRGDILVGWDDRIDRDESHLQVDGPLKARRLDANGNFLGNEFEITDKATAFDLDLLALKNGGFLAAWNELTYNGPNVAVSYTVKLREFDAMGNPVGRERAVSEHAVQSANPMLIDGANGNPRLVWHNKLRERDDGSLFSDPHVVVETIDTEWLPGVTRKGDGSLNGTARDDYLAGRNRADILKGLGGDDDLRGNGGRDRLIGGQGRDGLEGGAGNDRLSGGGGNDIIAGGRGNDVLKGGTGRDQFIFRESTGTDRILDFDASRDSIYLQDSWYGDDFAATFPRVSERNGNTIIEHQVADASAKIILKGVTGLEYDDLFTDGPIFIY